MTLRNRLDVEFDFYLFSLHKLYGPHVGAMYDSPNVRLVGHTTADRTHRLPTFSCTADDWLAADFPTAVATDGVRAGSGDFYTDVVSTRWDSASAAAWCVPAWCTITTTPKWPS
ncbi:MAG: hypothetical protein OEQ39_13535 [Gammaproteobacteria bacterium]|nr:hypothetical protein [Gammaproteobacteria bacterium]MDH3464970.1 hypothetical protein [Gammaproteobacteria bacterium]